jgi:hypothetical protein
METEGPRQRAAALEDRVLLELTAGRLTAEDADLVAKLVRDVREGTFLVRCAWCQRYHRDGDWFAAPAGFTGTCELLDSPTTHGICPECMAIVSV